MVAARSCPDRDNVQIFLKVDSTSFGRSSMSNSRRASTCSKVCKRSPGTICEKISHSCLRNTYSPKRKHRKPQASPRIVVARLLIVSLDR